MQELDINKFLEAEFSKISKSVNSVLDVLNISRIFGYGLLVLALFDIVDMFIPFKLMNPVWEFQTIGKLVERVAVPLIGLLLVFSGKFELRSKWEFPLLALLSRLTLLVGILYILLIPLAVSDTFKLHDSVAQINIQYAQQLAQAEQAEKQLTKATPEEIENNFKRQGRSLNGQNPAEIKKQLLAQLAQSKQQLKTQAEENKSTQSLNLLKSSVKWNLGALISAALFISFWKGTGWARKRS